MTHHEHWDGKGYYGMAGEEIPLAGRIAAVADVFDALTHERPYKHAWSFEDSLSEITAQSGYQFDPTIVDAFVRIARTAYEADLTDATGAASKATAD